MRGSTRVGLRDEAGSSGADDAGQTTKLAHATDQSAIRCSAPGRGKLLDSSVCGMTDAPMDAAAHRVAANEPPSGDAVPTNLGAVRRIGRTNLGAARTEEGACAHGENGAASRRKRGGLGSKHLQQTQVLGRAIPTRIGDSCGVCCDSRQRSRIFSAEVRFDADSLATRVTVTLPRAERRQNVGANTYQVGMLWALRLSSWPVLLRSSG